MLLLFWASMSFQKKIKLLLHRAKKIQKFLTQPLFSATFATGIPGEYVPIKDTVEGFARIINGELDALPEDAFYMVGSIDQAIKKAKELTNDETRNRKR